MTVPTSANTFEVSWQLDDGYPARAIPHTFEVDITEVEGMSESELVGWLEDRVHEDFNQTIGASADCNDEFVAWALANSGTDEDEEGTAS